MDSLLPDDVKFNDVTNTVPSLTTPEGWNINNLSSRVGHLFG